MATQCRFLLNDFFRAELDETTGGWGIDNKAGNNRSDAKLLHTFRDGQLHTSENFIKQGSEDNLLIITDDLPYSVCDTVGLINTNLIGALLSVGQSAREEIQGFNAIVKSPVDTGAANVFVDSTDSVTVGSISLVYMGCATEFNAWYPVGWKPPFLREYRVKEALSDDGLPLALHRSQIPVRYTIPLRMVEESSDLERLVALLHRLQRENFLFQWDTNDARNILYGWMVQQGEMRYEAHGLVSVDLEVEGYYQYGN